MELSVKLNKNIYKKKPLHPDLTGNSLINGMPHDFAGWYNTDGTIFLKCKPLEMVKKNKIN